MKVGIPYSLHDQLKKHLFQGRKERRNIVAEEGHFQFAFSCFQNFEVSAHINYMYVIRSAET